MFTAVLLVSTVASAGIDLTLELDGACPGPVDITITGVPGTRYMLVVGDDVGESVVPGGTCRGEPLPVVAEDRLQAFGPLADADRDGVVTVRPSLPPGVCAARFTALDLTTCWTSPAMTVGEDPVPDDGLWVHGNYFGEIAEYDGAVRYDGPVDCGITCAAMGGLDPVGARFVCNLAGVGPTEGCDDSNDGEYGDANCGLMVRDFEVVTENGNLEDCTRSSIEDCVYGACDEGVTYHSVQCQCR